MLDAAANDPSLFIHRAEVAAAWSWIDPIIEAWQRPENNPQFYKAGGWGPRGADEMIHADGREWFNMDDVFASEEV